MLLCLSFQSFFWFIYSVICMRNNICELFCKVGKFFVHMKELQLLGLLWIDAVFDPCK